MFQLAVVLCWFLSSSSSLASAFVVVTPPIVARTDVSSRSALAMGLVLYGSQGSRSPLVNWALYELGLEYAMGDLEENPHPFGQIPCLRNDEDGSVVFESGAILLYLYSLLDGKKVKTQEAEILSWVTWSNASLDPICFLETPEGKVYDTGLKKPNRRIDTLNDILESREYLVGNQFSVADIAVASYLLYVLQFFPEVDLQRWPHMVNYLKQCAKRPAYAKAFGDNIQTFLLKALDDTGKPRMVWDMF